MAHTKGSEASQGLMCCDQNGLCLKTKGDINPLHAGTYTAMIRLASQLDGIESTSVMVSMETDRSVTVIKQYDDHTVVMKVPSSESGQDHDDLKEETADFTEDGAAKEHVDGAG